MVILSQQLKFVSTKVLFPYAMCIVSGILEFKESMEKENENSGENGLVELKLC